MCSDNPNLPKEANKAKCFVISCLVLCAPLPRVPIPVSPGLSPRVHMRRRLPTYLRASSIFSMLGFGLWIPGIIGAIGGIIACVASSIIICCGPKGVEEGSAKFTAVRKSAHGTATQRPHA